MHERPSRILPESQSPGPSEAVAGGEAAAGLGPRVLSTRPPWALHTAVTFSPKIYTTRFLAVVPTTVRRTAFFL